MTAPSGRGIGSSGSLRTRCAGQSGFALVGFLAVLLPLVGLAGAMVTAMGGRNDRLLEDVRQEKALLAAEAGIDEANYRSATGGLQDGVTFSRTLPGGASFTVEPTHLLADGLDNDGDAVVDEEDEDVFQVVVTGTYVGARRRLVAYVPPAGPAAIEAAMTIYHQDPQTQLDFKDAGHVSGYDTNLDGTPGPNVVPGIAIMPPADLDDLTANFQTDDPSRITGEGDAPSLAVASGGLDLDQVVEQAKAEADYVLGDSYKSGYWGDGPSGDFNVIYREGDLALDGDIQGAGLMVVTGKLQVYGGFHFDGVIIVLGDLQVDGSSGGGVTLDGALIKGTSSQVQFADAIRLTYSSEAIASTPIIGTGSGGGATAGWKEIGTK